MIFISLKFVPVQSRLFVLSVPVPVFTSLYFFSQRRSTVVF